MPNLTPEAVAAGAATGLGESAIQYKLNSAEADKAYQRQQQLLRKEYDYNQQAQKNSYVNAVESAKRAGLSPVAVLGQSFAPAGASASGVSSASVSRPELSPDRVVSQSDLLAAQVENLAAQNENIKEQTRGNKIDNDRKDDADSVVTENMRSHLDAIVNKFKSLGVDVSELESKIEQIDNGDRSYTLGALLANQTFEAYRRAFNENLPSYDKAYLETIVAYNKATNKAVWDALERMPQVEYQKYKAEITELYSRAQELAKRGKLDEKEIEKLNADIGQINVNIRRAVVNDPKLALDVGDIDAFERWLKMDIYDRALNFGAEFLNKKTAPKKGMPPGKKTEYIGPSGELKGTKIETPEMQLNYRQKPSRWKRRRHYA